MLVLKEGEATATIYEMIRQHQYRECIDALNTVHHMYTQSRPAVSLLGYCYYQVGDFINAADCYEQLSLMYPELDAYRLYYAQSLCKSGIYDEAMRVSCQIENTEYRPRIMKLQAAVHFGKEDLSGTKNSLEQCSAEDLDTEYNKACVLYRERNYMEASSKFVQLMASGGYNPDLMYSIAVCYYMMIDYMRALTTTSEIIAIGAYKHPELAIGLSTDGHNITSVGNSSTLLKTSLIEAFNLQAAIHYNLKSYELAHQSFIDMPPRSEEELDPFTLHNQALLDMDAQPAEGFTKLQFLLNNEPFPAETLANLLVLFIKFGHYDKAADALVEHSRHINRCLTPFVYSFVEAVIMKQKAPEDAYRKLNEMAVHQLEILRKLQNEIKEGMRNDESDTRTILEFDTETNKYITVMMQQAKIHWDLKNYVQVEKLFWRSPELFSNEYWWKVNFAHVLYVQGKYQHAVRFYEPIIAKQMDSLIEVEPIALANLCVSYILTHQMEIACELMLNVAKEEKRLENESPEKVLFHSSNIDLVTGTMYCARGNFEYGLSRVICSLSPPQQKLAAATWNYAKRSFLYVIENLAKRLIVLKDSDVKYFVNFLKECEIYGRNIRVYDDHALAQNEGRMQLGKNTITFESRLLKYLLLQVV